MCELCGGKFSDRSSLRNHMKNIHGERKYECETCGKKFATPGMRNHHMNEMHNNTYNYECSICGEQFNVSFKYRFVVCNTSWLVCGCYIVKSMYDVFLF